MTAPTGSWGTTGGYYGPQALSRPSFWIPGNNIAVSCSFRSTSSKPYTVSIRFTLDQGLKATRAQLLPGTSPEITGPDFLNTHVSNVFVESYLCPGETGKYCAFLNADVDYKNHLRVPTSLHINFSDRYYLSPSKFNPQGLNFIKKDKPSTITYGLSACSMGQLR